VYRRYADNPCSSNSLQQRHIRGLGKPVSCYQSLSHELLAQAYYLKLPTRLVHNQYTASENTAPMALLDGYYIAMYHIFGSPIWVIFNDKTAAFELRQYKICLLSVIRRVLLVINTQA